MRHISNDDLQRIANLIIDIERGNNFILGAYITTDDEPVRKFEFDGEKFTEDDSLVIYKRSRDETNIIP